MLPRPRAGDIQQSALGFVDVVELCFVRGIGDTLIKRQYSFVAGHNDDSAEFQALGQAHRSGRHVVVARDPGDRGSGARDKLRRSDEQADLMGCDALAKPGLNGLANGVGFRGDGGEGFHFGRRTVEDRDDAAPLIFQPISVAQHRRQQSIGGAADLLRSAVADFERVRPAPHIDAKARPGKRMLENPLAHVARQEQAICLRGRQSGEEPQLRRGEVLGFVDDDMVERLASAVPARQPGR